MFFYHGSLFAALAFELWVVVVPAAMYLADRTWFQFNRAFAPARTGISTTGRVPGIKIPADDYDQMQADFDAMGVNLVRNETLPPDRQLKPDIDAKFRYPPAQGARPTIVLRENATYYELWHEYVHYVDWRRNPALFESNVRQGIFLPHEQFAYDTLRNGPVWWALNAQERDHAHRLIRFHGGEARP